MPGSFEDWGMPVEGVTVVKFEGQGVHGLFRVCLMRIGGESRSACISGVTTRLVLRRGSLSRMGLLQVRSRRRTRMRGLCQSRGALL